MKGLKLLEYVGLAERVTPERLRQQMRENMVCVAKGNGNRAVRRAERQFGVLLQPGTMSRI